MIITYDAPEDHRHMVSFTLGRNASQGGGLWVLPG